jgi:hypothetical protein
MAISTGDENHAAASPSACHGNGHASTSNLEAAVKPAMNGAHKQREEMQYLNMIEEIMSRGQIRVSIFLSNLLPVWRGVAC